MMYRLRSFLNKLFGRSYEKREKIKELDEKLFPCYDKEDIDMIAEETFEHLKKELAEKLAENLAHRYDKEAIQIAEETFEHLIKKGIKDLIRKKYKLD
jgi:hypothetical protein